MGTRTLLLAPAALALLLASGCGGTNSETPWPVPPDDVDLGPEGEARRDEELLRSRRAPAPEAPPATTSEVPAAPPASQF